MAKLAFYKAKHGNFVDKLIAWWTNSEYSHVELVINDAWYSTSPRDLKVRKAYLIPNEKHWDFIDIKIDQNKVEDFYSRTKGAKYDWLGISLTQIINLEIHNPKKWFCSEWVAKALGLKNTNRYSPQDLYDEMI